MKDTVLTILITPRRFGTFEEEKAAWDNLNIDDPRTQPVLNNGSNSETNRKE